MQWRKGRLAILAMMAMFAIAGCGQPAGDESSHQGTTTISVGIALPAAFSSSGFETQAAKGTPLDVLSVAVEVYVGFFGAIPIGVTPTQTVFLSQHPVTKVWSGTLSALPLGTTLTFVGRAYNVDAEPDPVNLAIPANEIYQGFTVAALAGNDSLTLDLFSIDDGNGVLLPSIGQIFIPAQIAVNTAVLIDIQVSGQSGETLAYEFTSGGGTLPSGILPITLDGGGNGLISATYTAPGAVGVYSHSIKVTNSQGNSVSTGFATNVVLSVTNADITVQFAPVITAIAAQRNGSQLTFTATVSDDVLPLNVTYQWGLTGGPAGTGISGATETAILQPYDETVTGTVSLTVTDEGGAGNFTQITFAVPFFADNPVTLISDVALFADPLWVDYSPGVSSAEASNLEDTLVLLGYTVSTFVGDSNNFVSAATITGAVDRRAVLTIPELEKKDLNGALDAAGRTAIRDFVQLDGGTLIVTLPGTRETTLLNAVFGFALAPLSPVSPYSLNAADANGTEFSNGPATLSHQLSILGVNSNSLPAGARKIYTDANGDSVVTLIPFGAGEIVITGWDWDNARPTGTVDGGWLKVLDIAMRRALGLSAIFADTFEDGDFAGWTLGSGPSTGAVTSITAAAGSTFSFSITGSSGHLQGFVHPFPAMTPNYIGFYARSGSPTASDTYFVVGDDDMTAINSMTFIHFGSGGVILVSTPGQGLGVQAYTANTWYHIELRNIDWTAKSFDLYVDDVLKLSAVSFRSTTVSALTQVHLYNFDNSQSWWDEILFSQP